jgi:hypothetical protein
MVQSFQGWMVGRRPIQLSDLIGKTESFAQEAGWMDYAAPNEVADPV